MPNFLLIHGWKAVKKSISSQSMTQVSRFLWVKPSAIICLFVKTLSKKSADGSVSQRSRKQWQQAPPNEHLRRRRAHRFQQGVRQHHHHQHLAPSSRSSTLKGIEQGKSHPMIDFNVCSKCSIFVIINITVIMVNGQIWPRIGSWGQDIVRPVHFGVFSTSMFHFAYPAFTSDWMDMVAKCEYSFGRASGGVSGHLVSWTYI